MNLIGIQCEICIVHKYLLLKDSTALKLTETSSQIIFIIGIFGLIITNNQAQRFDKRFIEQCYLLLDQLLLIKIMQFLILGRKGRERKRGRRWCGIYNLRLRINQYKHNIQSATDLLCKVILSRLNSLLYASMLRFIDYPSKILECVRINQSSQLAIINL